VETHCILGTVATENLLLSGQHVRLEPLDHRHVDGLVAASTIDSSLYQWSPVPQNKADAIRYIDTALAWRDAGTAVPFATVRVADGVVIRIYAIFRHGAMGLAGGPCSARPGCCRRL